jgi:hypothetical protein
MNGNDFAADLRRPAVLGLVALVCVGLAAFFAGAIAAPQLMWANLLVVSYYLLGVGLGGAVLLALFWVTGARWCATIRPATKKLIYLLPAGIIGVGIVLLARPSLYPWTNSDAGDQLDSTFQGFWLVRGFFLCRAFTYMALWLVFAFFLMRGSRQEVSGGTGSGKVGLSAAFLVVFSITCSLAGTDWIMSLEPKWSSTIFGVYQFSGMFLSALAAVIVLAVWLDHKGMIRGKLTRDQLRDLGTLLFAFSSFWMYIWFSQYLLIWFVNNPEETEYLVLRQNDMWQPLLLANLILNWAVPFLVLLFRPAKENARVLLAVALIVLVGRWLDLYLMILPPVAGTGPVFEIWDAGLLLGAVALAALILRGRYAPARSV